jgi:hypothetical protein
MSRVAGPVVCAPAIGAALLAMIAQRPMASEGSVRDSAWRLDLEAEFFMGCLLLEWGRL